MSAIRVLIGDDHSVLRAGLRMLLGAQPDIDVVGEAKDGDEAVTKARELGPDVVLLDLSMPGPRSSEVIRDVLGGHAKTKVLVLTMHDDAAYMRASLASGATGYLVKKAADTELMTAIRAVHAGRTFVDFSQEDPAKGGTRLTRVTGAGLPPKHLSKRERDVLRLLAQGHSNRQIADSMRVSVKTIETYRVRLSEKLGLKGRAELYRFASESGILDAEVPERR